MTPIESERVLQALRHLRRANHLYPFGSIEEAIGCDRSARIILAELLRADGIEPDDHMTSEGEPID